MAIRRIAKPSVRELFDNRHVSYDPEEREFTLCACIQMKHHDKSETIYG